MAKDNAVREEPKEVIAVKLDGELCTLRYPGDRVKLLGLIGSKKNHKTKSDTYADALDEYIRRNLKSLSP